MVPEPQHAEELKTKRRQHHTLHIDMTPMVDLGFLLITFFIFTAALSEPKGTPLIMPADGENSPLAESKALTLLLDENNRITAYEGRWDDAMAQNRVILSNYGPQEGVGQLIRQKQNALKLTGGEEAKEELMLVIKPTAKASYKNVIDALDEATINGVKKYAIVEPGPAEKTYLLRQN